jgi:hypothetical protein
MSTLTRILALLTLLAILATPPLTRPRGAHADLCTACADPDDPEVALLHVALTRAVVLRHTEESR